MMERLDQLKLEYGVAKVHYDALMKKRAVCAEEARLCDANAVAKLQEVVIESHNAKHAMMEKELQYFIAEAESMQELDPKNAAVLSCQTAREAYIAARDARNMAMRSVLVAWGKAEEAAYEAEDRKLREASWSLEAAAKKYVEAWKATK